AQRQIASCRPSTNATRSAHLCQAVDRNDAPPLGFRRVFVQVCHDLYGTKDVQDAITATYVWCADQIGHLTLGFVPTLLLCWAWRGIWELVRSWVCPSCGEGGGWWQVGYVVVAGLVFAYWVYKEMTDYHDTFARRGNVFPFDSSDIWWNVETALLYFAIGGLLALAAFFGIVPLLV